MHTHSKSAGARRLAVVAIAVAVQLGYSVAAQASCGSAFCGVNTSWDAQGEWTQPGLRADLRFEFIDQDQPRHGSDKVAFGEIERHHDEVRTLNRNWLLNLDYGFDAHWGVALTLPVANRDHDHIHNHHEAGGVEHIPEAWNFTEVGDVRVLGRYRMTQAAGVKFGLKLPSGDHEVANDEGDLAERTLQPGSGTTDILLGGFYQGGNKGAPLHWFTQALWQHPLNERADFKPGYQLGIDAGIDYPLAQNLSGLLQVNVQIKGRDSGADAEREDSGAQTLALSPGLSYAVTRSTRVYGFVQLPVYQYVNGVQLTVDRAYVAGVTMMF
ncbi:MAG: hypothetical protein HY941_03810 [Gammaproteobacteria bacterium]|nr:hypothetical protein [Gammaproteobacteria bacterium]